MQRVVFSGNFKTLSLKARRTVKQQQQQQKTKQDYGSFKL